MTLVDTSVWVDHLRNANSRLQNLLHDGEVLIHPFIVGELSCGNLKNREEILRLLSALPQVEVAQHAEALKLVESNQLFGRGIGWIDVHLLAAEGYHTPRFGRSTSDSQPRRRTSESQNRAELAS